MNLSSSIVSLLIALVSVTALSAQHIKEVFDKGHSNVRLAIVNSAEGMISLFAVNDGNRSGAISPAELDVYDSRFGNAQYIMVPNDGSFIVEPGKTKQINLEFKKEDTVAQHRMKIEEKIQEYNINPKKKFKTGCTLEISIIQHEVFQQVFDAQERKIKLERLQLEREGAVRKSKDEESPIVLPPDESVKFTTIWCDSIFPWLTAQRYSIVDED